MWRPIAQSLQGPSHLAEQSPCQDSNSVRVFGQPPHEILLACVADGAGSARHSDIGSNLACATVAEKAAEHFAEHGHFDGFELADALRWCDAARARIKQEAGDRDCSTRELATTLCVAIVSPTRSVFFQIGDGAMILGQGGVYGVVFWPQSGEYANSTNFITADEYQKQLEFLATPTRFSDIALFTDGLERLALRFDTLTPHPPFFDPLFRALRAAQDVERLSEDLRRFLGTDPVQTRSDDDKTLILASRCQDGHAV